MTIYSINRLQGFFWLAVILAALIAWVVLGSPWVFTLVAVLGVAQALWLRCPRCGMATWMSRWGKHGMAYGAFSARKTCCDCGLDFTSHRLGDRIGPEVPDLRPPELEPAWKVRERMRQAPVATGVSGEDPHSAHDPS